VGEIEFDNSTVWAQIHLVQPEWFGKGDEE
jgi:hypothetical protein